MSEERSRILVIAGPTATGKSSLAVELALNLGGEIVNADSMQVFRGMNVGTAKPTREERRGVPHHLFDVADPDEPFNAARFRSMAFPVIEQLARKGAPCLVVGGTGLYIRALLGGLFPCPEASPELRSRLRKEWDEGGGAAMHDRLRRLDPEAVERIHPNDRVRVIRALEVIELTGCPFSSMARGHRFREESFDALKICLHMDRERLYERIHHRSRRMMEAGLLDETRALLDRGYSATLKPMRAIGYRHAVMCLLGEWDHEETVQRIRIDTRRYAKRQFTWFRGEGDYAWRTGEERDRMLREAEAFFSRSP